MKLRRVDVASVARLGDDLPALGDRSVSPMDKTEYRRLRAQAIDEARAARAHA